MSRDWLYTLGLHAYESLARPLLFGVSGDAAHELGRKVLDKGTLWRMAPVFDPAHVSPLSTSLFEKDLPHPIGVAAGLNKDGLATAAFDAFGFSFVTVGSIRSHPHPGNPRPWMVRQEDRQALVNSMGMPSEGVRRVVEEMRGRKGDSALVGSIVGRSVEEFSRLAQEVAPVVDFIELNDSCPNVEEGTFFEEDAEVMEEQLSRVTEAVSKPVLLKISPILPSERERLHRIVDLCREYRVGISACNTRRVRHQGLGSEFGGLSGVPISEIVEWVVSEIHQYGNGEVETVGIGGVFSGVDALRLVGCGARAVGVLTSVIYRGPALLSDVLAEMQRYLEDRGLRLEDFRGMLAPKVASLYGVDRPLLEAIE